MTGIRFLPGGGGPRPVVDYLRAQATENTRIQIIPSESSVSTHKVEQRRLSHRGREFHFVSYDAQIANERRGVEAVPPMWYLMNEGKRRPVLPHVPGQELVELDDALLRWVDEQVFGTKASVLQRQRK
jgi:hypothetical protein